MSANKPSTALSDSKPCGKCGITKPLQQFPPEPRNRDGRRCNCMACRAIVARERYHANKSGQKKLCRICNRRLPILQFSVISKRSSWYCNDCTPIADQRYREVQKQWTERNRVSIRERATCRRRKNIERTLLYMAKGRARQKGIAFDLEVSDIVIPEVCPVLGIPVSLGVGSVHAGSPSIDRIDPASGYVKGNVVVVSHKANTIKSNATIEELEKVVEFYKGLLNRPAPIIHQ